MPKNKDEPVFKLPEFNEEEYLKYERNRSSTTIVVFVFAILAGFAEGFLELFGYGYLSVLLFLVLLMLLFRILGYLKLPIPQRSSHKFYLIAVFFLASILFWSLALNPPISVNTEPSITMQYLHNGSWVNVNQTNGKFTLFTITSLNKYEIRDNVSFINSVSLVYVTSPTLSSAVLNYSQNGNFIYYDVAMEPVNSEIQITLEMHSAGKFYNETQTIEYISPV
ncbi:hypothetical protein [Caldiplasma sukawensis]